jgi:hypothetical protein
MSLKYTKTAGNLVRLTDVITHDDLRRSIARLIEEARRMVTEQKGRIARLKATGVDTAFAELTLRALEANLKRFQIMLIGRSEKNRIRQNRLGSPANDSPRRTARCFAAGPR